MTTEQIIERAEREGVTEAQIENGGWDAIPEAAPEPVLVGEDGTRWVRRPCQSCGYLTLEPVERPAGWAMCNACFCR